MNDRPGASEWYCVRTVFRFDYKPPSTYEERLTLWCTTDFSTATALAEAEAREYAHCLDRCEFTGLTQAYQLTTPPVHGTEVFSLMRDSTLGADAYLSTFFDTGNERQGHLPER